MLREATNAGVVEVKTTHRAFANPNKWNKHLAVVQYAMQGSKKSFPSGTPDAWETPCDIPEDTQTICAAMQTK